MTRRYTRKVMIVGIVVAAAFVWSERARAGEEFGAVVGVPVQAMTAGDMATVEGKLVTPAIAARVRKWLETQPGLPVSSGPALRVDTFGSALRSDAAGALLPSPAPGSVLRLDPDPNPFDFSPSQALNAVGRTPGPVTTLPAQVLKSIALPTLVK